MIGQLNGVVSPEMPSKYRRAVRERASSRSMLGLILQQLGMDTFVIKYRNIPVHEYPFYKTLNLISLYLF